MPISAEKKYEILVTLYKHYNDILLKGTAFVYAMISSLVAFYMTRLGVTH